MERLIERVSRRPDFHKERPRREMLIIPRISQNDGPHGGGIVSLHILCHRHGEGEILLPVVVIRADDKAHLRYGGILLCHQFILIPLGILHSIAVNVDDVVEGGILLQIGGSPRF